MNILTNKLARVVLVSLGVVAIAGPALADKPYWAGRGHDEYRRDDDFARVIDVQPIVRRVRISTPEQQCWDENRPVYGGRSGTVARATIVGGLIGAVVGHQLGHHGHDAGATVGGSLIGAAIGNSIGADQARARGDYGPVAYRTVQRCEVTYRDRWEEQIDGYRVTYEYNGREYTARMPYDPGRRIRVNVDVRPGYDRFD